MNKKGKGEKKGKERQEVVEWKREGDGIFPTMKSWIRR